MTEQTTPHIVPNEAVYDGDKTPPMVRERGGCLGLWLLFFIIVNGFWIYAGFMTGAFTVQFVLNAIGVISGFGLLLWQRWAYYSIMIIYAVALVFGILGGNHLGSMYALTFLALTVVLVNPKKAYLR